MKPSRLWWLVTALAIVAAALLITWTGSAPSGRVDPGKIMAAAQAFAGQLRAEGKAIPAEAPLNQLVERGLLQPEDVSGFAGFEVSVTLQPDANDPRQVLMRARMPDGGEIVALNDGSVQQHRK